MIEPYKMIIVNVIALGLLSAILGVYRFLYPKKPIHPLLLVVLLSLLPIISILRAGTYESGDLSLHTYRLISFFQNLQEGNFFPEWAGELNATYGYPLFIYLQPLPYYIASLFHVMGTSFIDSLKLIYALTFVASGVTMYVWAKAEFDSKSAVVASIFYLYAPYHLVDMHFRANPAEMLSFVFFPLAALAIKKLMKTDYLPWIFIGGFSFALLVLSHPIAIAICTFLFFYAVFLVGKKDLRKKYLILSVTFLLGLLLSCFYWLPELLEGKYVHQSLINSSTTFRPLYEYIYSPWRLGFLFQGNKGELSFVIGYIQWLVIFLAILFFVKNIFDKREKKYISFFLSAFFIIFVLMQSISKPIWDTLPFFSSLQFSFRLMAIEVFITAAIAAITIRRIKKPWIIGLICFFAIFSTILNWGNRRTIPEITDAILMQQLPGSSYAGEGLANAIPKNINNISPWEKNLPTQKLEFVKGEGNFKEMKRTSTDHKYFIDAKTSVIVKENTLYFPNWVLLVNGKEKMIYSVDPQYPGIITFSLPKGVYNIELIFRDTQARYFSLFISAFSFILLVLTVLFLWFKKYIRLSFWYKRRSVFKTKKGKKVR